MLNPSKSLQRLLLGNGLEVILAPDSSRGMASVSLVFPFGATVEQEARGRAHLLEHVYMGLEDEKNFSHAGWLEKVGGIHVNACTYPDCTSFFYSVPSSALYESLRRGGERHSRRVELICDAVVEREKRVVLAELHEASEDLISNNIERAQNAVFDASCWYLGSVLGRPDDIGATSIGDLKRLAQRGYQLSGAVCAVTGVFNPEQVVRELERWNDKTKYDDALPIMRQSSEPEPWLAWHAPGLGNGDSIGVAVMLHCLNRFFRRNNVPIKFHWRGAKKSSLVLASHVHELFSTSNRTILLRETKKAIASATASSFYAALDALFLSHLYTRFQEGGMTGYAQRLARGCCVYANPNALIDELPFLSVSFHKASEMFQNMLGIDSTAQTHNLTECTLQNISLGRDASILAICAENHPHIQWQHISHRDPLLAEIVLEWRIDSKDSHTSRLSQPVLISVAHHISKKLREAIPLDRDCFALSTRFVGNFIRNELTTLRKHLDVLLKSLIERIGASPVAVLSRRAVLTSFVLATQHGTPKRDDNLYLNIPGDQDSLALFRHIIRREFSPGYSREFFRATREGIYPIYDYDVLLDVSLDTMNITILCPEQVLDERKQEFAHCVVSILKGYRDDRNQRSRISACITALRLGVLHAKQTPHLSCHGAIHSRGSSELLWLDSPDVNPDILADAFLDWIQCVAVKIRVASLRP